jgi:peroxiredoxin
VAPGFSLPELDGHSISLEEYRGRRIILVFSDPNCGPCNILAPRLEELSRRTPDIQVIMVSRGDPETNKAKATEHHLTFPVLLQRRWEVSRLYAMFATPIAYYIDQEGVIRGNVAVGAEQIIRLLAAAAIKALLETIPQQIPDLQQFSNE